MKTLREWWDDLDKYDREAVVAIITIVLGTIIFWCIIGAVDYIHHPEQWRL